MHIALSSDRVSRSIPRVLQMKDKVVRLDRYKKARLVLELKAPPSGHT